MIAILTSLFTAIAFRLRGGGWITFGSNVPCRTIWGAALAISYALTAGSSVHLAYLSLVPLLGYGSMYIPHAYAQNMGRWLDPQKKWPSFLVPTVTLQTWTAWPAWKRTCYDTLNMACVGFWRGSLVFLPFAYYSLTHAILAIVSMVVLQPVTYFLGWYVPVKVTTSLMPKTTEWCEFLNGAAWTLAMVCL